MLSQSASIRLATQLEVLPLLLSDASPEAITQRPPSGKWSAHENLAHLARHHEVFVERLRRILTEDKPDLPRYRAEDDPEWSKWQAMSTDEVLKRLKALRGDIIELIKPLSPGQPNRYPPHLRGDDDSTVDRILSAS